MPLYDSQAVILRSIRLGEADKIVTFFTSRFGKVKAVAKGAYRPKSRFGGRLEPFTQVKVIFFGKEKAELFRLNSLDIVESFIPLRDDLEKLSRAYVSAELVDACQKEGDVNREGFGMLLSFWRSLLKDTRPERMDLMLRLFEMRFLSQIGLRPVLDRCVSCGGALEGRQLGFNAVRGGAVCGGCLGTDFNAERASRGVIKLVERALATPASKLERLSASMELLGELERLASGYVSAHVPRKIRSEKFLKEQAAMSGR